MSDISIYSNGPQIRSELMQTNTEVNLLARGTGKTVRIISSRAIACVLAMPRSTGAIITRTYRQALTNTLPPAIKGWKDRGFQEGFHFVIGKRPPDWFLKPFVEPLDYKYSISWYNGTIIHLISQDRPGSANGLSIDWKIVDECKFIDIDKYNAEIVPASRGNTHLFGKHWLHQSTLFCTDRWFGKEAEWIYDLEKKVDNRLNKLIETLSMEQMRIKLNIHKKKYSKHHLSKLGIKLNSIEQSLNELRKNAVWFNYASAIENYHILGKDFFIKQRIALPSNVFEVTVLNEKRSKTESPFYPHLDRKFHCYNNFNYDALSKGYNINEELKFDCTHDNDVDLNKKLYLAIDPGAAINALVVAQYNDESNEIKVLKGIEVLSPSLTIHAIEKFCNYYKEHKTREVVYYYNPTHVAKHGATDNTYKSIIISTLYKNGWNVAPFYYRKVPEYKDRYNLISKLLSDKSIPKKISFNEINCENLLISIEGAETEEHQGRFRKNKKSEKPQSGVPQENATHYSDAFDDLIWGIYHDPHPLELNDSIEAISI